MFGNIESYFPSDNIHLFVPFRTPSVAYISINLFQIKQQKLALPSSPFANQFFSARMNICEGWSPVGWGPARPTWSPSPPGSKFSSSSPLFSNPDLPPACSKTSGKKSRTTKKTHTHPPPWSFRVIFRLWLWEAPRLKRGLQAGTTAHGASGCWQGYQKWRK